jgi:protein-S-isoprenylcysteine O-methyltransferase Ste14
MIDTDEYQLVRGIRLFNVEPQEEWNAEEAAEFERYVAARHKKTLHAAAWAGGGLLLNILCIVPFLAGHSLHRYWEVIGKNLLLLAMALFLWCVLKVGAVWASWQSARETRREFRDPQ